MSKVSADVVRRLRPFLSKHRARRIEEVLSTRLAGVRVLTERFFDHGNIVAVMRTCEAFGVYGIDLLEFDAPFKPAKKVGQGAHKWLDVHKHVSVEKAVDKLKTAGYRLVGATLSANRRLEEIDVASPLVLVLGNEHEGITPELETLCDEAFCIPMMGYTQSLNVSCAAAITVYDVTRRYRQSIGCAGDLSDGEKNRLRAVYYRRAVKHSELLLKASANGRNDNTGFDTS